MGKPLSKSLKGCARQYAKNRARYASPEDGAKHLPQTEGRGLSCEGNTRRMSALTPHSEACENQMLAVPLEVDVNNIVHYTVHMDTTFPISQVRKNIFSVTDAAHDGAYITITENGKAKAVLMSVAEFDSWRETLEVVREFPNIGKDLTAARRAVQN